MIKLSSTPNNHISLTCLCTHWSLLPVTDLIKICGGDITVDQVENAARCTKCGVKGVIKTQIIFVGNSATAMASAHTPKDKKDYSKSNIIKSKKGMMANRQNFTLLSHIVYKVA